MSSCLKEIKPCSPMLIPQATKVISLPNGLNMKKGGYLQQVHIAYETWGHLSAAKDNAILIFTGLSPNTHAASSIEDASKGWWEFMIGPGKPLDTDKYYVICMNSLGSCFGSTGPASINEQTGAQYRLDFPELSIEDISEAAFEASKVLDIHKFHTVLGASLGGMAALAFATKHPVCMEHLVLISAAATATPFAIAIRSMQREMICNDPMWKQGNYKYNSPPLQGIKMARKLGLTSYRSAQEWQQRFARDRVKNKTTLKPESRFSNEFEIEAYLEHNAEKFMESFDANCYLYLSRSMDWFDIAENNSGDLAAALSNIQSKSNLVIGVESDILFPIEQQKHIADALIKSGKDTQFNSLDSIQGHDSFLVDKDSFSPILNEFLN